MEKVFTLILFYCFLYHSLALTCLTQSIYTNFCFILLSFIHVYAYLTQHLLIPYVYHTIYFLRELGRRLRSLVKSRVMLIFSSISQWQYRGGVCWFLELP